MPAITALAYAAVRPVGRVLVSVAAGAGRRLKHALEALGHRRIAMRLTELDDRMLADIGLTRSDLRDAYSEPLWRDPTDVLARRAAERRGNRGLFEFDCATVKRPVSGASESAPLPMCCPAMDQPVRCVA